MCISTGFQDEFIRKVLGVNAHVLVMKYGMEFHEYRDVMRTVERMSGVKAVEPFVIQEMMISKDTHSAGVLLKGVDPRRVGDVLDLPRHIVKGSVKGLRVTRDNKEKSGGALPGIIIGATLAENLFAKVGDTVQITTPLIGLSSLGWSDGKEAPRYLKFKVTGIFYAGFLEYDTKLVFVDLFEAQRFFDQGDSVTGLELVVKDMHRAGEVAARIEQRFGEGPYRTVDWEELNRPLFTALKTQKLAFVVLLSIIVGVAAFNIIATLVMMVFDKRREIAILKSMGASHAGILGIFLHAGTVVGIVGIAIGLVVGWSACWLLDRVGWPLDPEVYLIDHLPVTLDVMNFAASALVAFLICVVATVIPSITASMLRPVDGMRPE
jgi:lipoprotein-releasing system permease protein